MKLPFTLSTSISVFIGITTLFFVLKAYILGKETPAKPGEEDKISNSSLIMTVIYLIVIIVMQFAFNLSNAAAICSGSAQSFINVLMYTLVPNFFILGSVIALISAFPGWLSPFSNTFGYFFVNCLGLSKIFNSLLATRGGSELLTKICSDESLIINEMTPDNYKDFMMILGPAKGKKAAHEEGSKTEASSERGSTRESKSKGSILKSDYYELPGYSHLYKLVVWKELIAELLWYLLAGCLVVSISANAIVHIQCDYSTKDMQKIAQKTKENQEQYHLDQEQNKPMQYPKVV